MGCHSHCPVKTGICYPLPSSVLITPVLLLVHHFVTYTNQCPLMETVLPSTFYGLSEAGFRRFYFTRSTHWYKAQQHSGICLFYGFWCIKTMLALQGQAQEWLLTSDWHKKPCPTPASSLQNSDFPANCTYLWDLWCSLKIILCQENWPFLAIWVVLR